MNPAIPASYNARKAQPLDLMMKQAGISEGWDWFDPQLSSEELKAFLDESQRVAPIFARVFESDDGRKVLEHLCDITVRRPLWVFGMPDGEKYAALREGQNGLIWTILKLLAMGRMELPPYREGAQP
jgi:hypothetical protein